MGNERLIVLDIETYRTRNPKVVAGLELESLSRKPTTHYLKKFAEALAGGDGEPDTQTMKSRWDTESMRRFRVKWDLDQTAIDVSLAEPLLVGLRSQDSKIVHDVMMEPENAEKQLAELTFLLDGMTTPDTIWAGFNIAGFDLAVLVNTWRRFQIAPPKHFPVYVNGRWRGRVYDEMLRTPTKTPFVNLETVCGMYGVPMDDITFRGEAVDGSRVGEVYEAGEWDCLRAYNLADLHCEWLLYQAMTFGDTWGTYDGGIGEQLEAILKNDMTGADYNTAKQALSNYRAFKRGRRSQES